MPRKTRLHVPGGLYHVILRGNDRQPIFFCYLDYRIWMELVAEAAERFTCRIHAFCWMTNHVHLAIQVGDAPLHRIMHWLATGYSRKMNRRLVRTGHFFERRYRAMIVDADAYLVTLVRYIHLNPVGAGIVDRPERYPWSSHMAYLGMPKPHWLTTDFLLAALAPTRRQARLSYASLMDDAAGWALNALPTHPRDDRVIGDDDFLNRLDSGAGTDQPLRSLSNLVREYCEKHDVTESELCSPARTRRLARIRACIALAAQEEGVAGLREVAARFNRSAGALSRSVARLRDRTKLSTNK